MGPKRTVYDCLESIELCVSAMTRRGYLLSDILALSMRDVDQGGVDQIRQKLLSKLLNLLEVLLISDIIQWSLT